MSERVSKEAPKGGRNGEKGGGGRGGGGKEPAS